MSTATVSKTAWLIWEATARFQISEYNLYRSPSTLPSTCAGRDRGGRRTNRLVCFLGVLRLRLVDARLFRHFVLAVQPGGDFADLGDRFGRQRHGVCTHVRDEADAAFADVQAFIQLLREPHRAPRVESQLAGGFLLQC